MPKGIPEIAVAVEIIKRDVLNLSRDAVES